MPKLTDSELAEFARALYALPPVNSRSLGELIDKTQSLTHKKLKGTAMTDREAKIIVAAYQDYAAMISKIIFQYENSRRTSKPRKRKVKVQR